MTEGAQEVIRVKRDGPRGWHWIAKANYDPAKHELVDDAPAPAAAPSAPAPLKRGPGRPRKNPIQGAI